MAYCAIKAGGTLTGTKRLKIKESNRGLAMKEELEKAGAQITIFEDEIVIKKLKPNLIISMIKKASDYIYREYLWKNVIEKKYIPFFEKIQKF